ncbi:hypothetical protein [Mycobacteroides abscessus]|uniref:hypothetical protein n=1 Tax=Mycobacteroides abscessus TaxID=36809 RepID=UPI0011505D56|nr:hypothetical protein [Mycobacteroides abscessus]MBN7481021.1 hypothetical protein [Mycobacteroides abscessus subsp. massiliense]
MTYPNNNPYGQFPQQGFGGQFPPPYAPAPMPAFGQPPAGTMGSGIWPREAVGKFVIGTWLTIAATVIGLAGLAAPVIALLAFPVGIGAWVYLIAGLIAAGREKRTPPRFPETGDIVLDTMARLRVFTPADEARMNAMVDAEEKGQQPYPPQYPQGF